MSFYIEQVTVQWGGGVGSYHVCIAHKQGQGVFTPLWIPYLVFAKAGICKQSLEFTFWVTDLYPITVLRMEDCGRELHEMWGPFIQQAVSVIHNERWWRPTLSWLLWYSGRQLDGNLEVQLPRLWDGLDVNEGVEFTKVVGCVWISKEWINWCPLAMMVMENLGVKQGFEVRKKITTYG